MKKYSLFIVGIFCMCCLIGIVIKGTYKEYDFTDEKNENEIQVTRIFNLEDYITYENSDNIEKDVYSQFEKRFSEADCVIKVRATGNIKNYSGCLSMECVVVECMSGGVKADEVIELISQNECMSLLNDEKIYGTSFVNIMKKNKDYLVFADRIHGLENVKKYYLLDKDCEVSYFQIDETESIITEDDSDVRYNQVKNNEFFAINEESMAFLQGLKKDILKQYIVNVK